MVCKCYFRFSPLAALLLNLGTPPLAGCPWNHIIWRGVSPLSSLAPLEVWEVPAKFLRRDLEGALVTSGHR